ncbi:unnamed protein product [Candidula unifasciata]|uniref:Uncharacterized protein n=1 Tax=Candidula unifasciata TaxID=100452 RepID=A0A8S3ZAF9_9EUPU|nr:unnamed protein product [Candidula unifasciata]
MNIETVTVFSLLMSMLCRIVEGTIMCSACRSDKSPDCETNPPPPQPCTESGSGVNQSCSTIRIFKTGTGELHQFIRSCSSSNSEKADCFASPPGYKTCANICYTDGCNSAKTSSNIHRLWSLPWLLLTLQLYTR